MTATRGTSNSNARGSSRDRERRREWLVATFRADVDLDVVVTGQAIEVSLGHGLPACRCYRCGLILAVLDVAGTRAVPERRRVTVDRIVPGCKGGTYRRGNIRPACGPCNSETGGRTRSSR